MAGNEIYLTYVAYIIPVIEVLIGGYCFYLLVKSLMGNKARAFWAGAVYFLAMLILYMIPLRFINFTAYSTGVFLVFLAMCMAERRNYGQKALIAVIFLSLHWFAYAMTDILRDKLYDTVLKADYMAAHPDM